MYLKAKRINPKLRETVLFKKISDKLIIFLHS